MYNELNKDVFKNLKAWIRVISKVTFITDEKTKTEFVVFLITKLISIQTLADFEIIDPQWLKNSWDSFNMKLYSHGKLTVLKKFFEQIDILFKEFFHRDLFELNLLEYIDENEDNITIFYQNLQLVLGLNDSQNSSNKFKGITQYNYQNINENILGKIYEKCLTEIRHDKGIYYTPSYIAEFIVENTVGEIFDQYLTEIEFQINEENFDEIKRLVHKFVSIKVLDPSCGSGTFLIEAFRVIKKKYGKLNRLISKLERRYYSNRGNEHNPDEVETKISQTYAVRNIFGPQDEHKLIFSIPLRHLFGIELDKNALNLTEIGLLLEIIKLVSSQFGFEKILREGEHHYFFGKTNLIHGNTVVGLPDEYIIEHLKQKKLEIRQLFEIRNSYISNFENMRPLIDIEHVKSTLRKELDEHFQRYLVNLNLASDILRTTIPLYWALEFWYVFFDQEGIPLDEDNSGFDIVVGNPPYIDSETMTKMSPNIRHYCAIQYASASGNWDLFCVFIEKGIKVTKNDGYLGYIIPNKLLAAEYSLETQKILEKYALKRIRDYSRSKVFETDTSVYPIVIILQKSSPKSNDTIQVEIFEEAEENGLKLSFENQITVEAFRKLPKGLWSPLVRENLPIIQKVLNISNALLQHGKIVGAASVSEAYKIKEILKETSESEFDQSNLVFVNTGTIDRYNLLWGILPTRYIKKTYRKPIVRSSDLRNISEKRLNESTSQKIIIAGITLRLEAIYDPGYLVAGKSTILVRPKDLDLKFLTACINSKLISFVYRELFESLSLHGGYLRIGPPQISRIPIRRINFSTALNTRKSLFKKAKKLYQKYLVTKDHNIFNDFIEDRLPKDKKGDLIIEKEESDIIYDILIYLTELIIALNKQKNEVITEFIEWFEREFDTQIENLTHKRKLIFYYDLDYNEFLNILEKNQNQIPIKLLDRAIQDSLRKMFEKNLVILSPLINKFNLVDELIDHIVYKLYGLTDEEIVIVEAAMKRKEYNNLR
ncbi:MAG: Eco57I restriction-modification methylase domain-containing protein [Promethearchaeota archaeon]